MFLAERKFAAVTCPQCLQSIKGTPVDRLPESCPVCLDVREIAARRAEEVLVPGDVTGGRLAQMQQNIAQLQGDSSQNSAAIQALRSDVNTLRSFIAELSKRAGLASAP